MQTTHSLLTWTGSMVTNTYILVFKVERINYSDDVAFGIDMCFLSHSGQVLFIDINTHKKNDCHSFLCLYGINMLNQSEYKSSTLCVFF